MTRPSVIMCAFLALMTVVVIESWRQDPKPPSGEQHTLHNLQVLANGQDDYHYEFRDERGTEFWVHFCEDYEPQFSAGMTLTLLTYQDMGDCWSVKNTHPAYLLKRDRKGKIIKEDFHVLSPEAPAYRPYPAPPSQSDTTADQAARPAGQAISH